MNCQIKKEKLERKQCYSSLLLLLIKAKTIIYMNVPLNCGTNDGAPNIKIT